MEIITMILIAVATLLNLWQNAKTAAEIKDAIRSLRFSGWMLDGDVWVRIPDEACFAGKALMDLRQGYGLVKSSLCDHVYDRKTGQFFLYPKGTDVKTLPAFDKKR